MDGGMDRWTGGRMDRWMAEMQMLRESQALIQLYDDKLREAEEVRACVHACVRACVRACDRRNAA